MHCQRSGGAAADTDRSAAAAAQSRPEETARLATLPLPLTAGRAVSERVGVIGRLTAAEP